MFLKRISHLEEIIKSLISKDEDFCTYLTEGQHFEDLKKRRSIISYYKKITQGNYPLTIENINTIENVFELGHHNTFSDYRSENSLNVHFTNEKKDELTDALDRAGTMLEIDEEEIELTEEDRVIEEEMAECFFNLPR